MLIRGYAMKKLILLSFLLFAACAPLTVKPTVDPTINPTATIMPSATATSTPVPTPTLNPHFVGLLNKINGAGNRFNLLLDGTIVETTPGGEKKTIPDLIVDGNGVFLLTVNGTQIELKREQVNMTNKWGVMIDGYSFEEQNKKWIEGILIPEYLDKLYFLKKITNDSTYFEVQERDLVSGALAEKIKKMYETSEIERLPNSADVYPVVPRNYESGTWWKTSGYEMYFESVNDWNVKVVIPGMVKVVDSDGNPKYWLVPKIIRANEAGDIGVMMLVEGWFDNLEKPLVVANIFNHHFVQYLGKYQPAVFKNIDACDRFYPKVPSAAIVCKDWYRTYRADYMKLLEEWAGAGAFPERLSRMPIFTKYIFCIGTC